MNDCADTYMAKSFDIEREARKIPIPGVRWGQLDEIRDHRGSFVKLYSRKHVSSLLPHGQVVESFMTHSAPGVLRGMHFQIPPKAYEKVVICMRGCVLDILLDLRIGSPTFKQYRRFRLSSSHWDYLLIPKGIAHGFLVFDEPALMLYHQTAEYAPDFDTGIKWNSFGFHWPQQNPNISDRDARFCSMDEFDSPFFFTAQEKQGA